MSTDYCRDPGCRQPLESEGWAPWCSRGCAHRWVWLHRIDWTEPDRQAMACAREAG